MYFLNPSHTWDQSKSYHAAPATQWQTETKSSCKDPHHSLPINILSVNWNSSQCRNHYSTRSHRHYGYCPLHWQRRLLSGPVAHHGLTVAASAHHDLTDQASRDCPARLAETERRVCRGHTITALTDRSRTRAQMAQGATGWASGHPVMTGDIRTGSGKLLAHYTLCGVKQPQYEACRITTTTCLTWLLPTPYAYNTSEVLAL